MKNFKAWNRKRRPIPGFYSERCETGSTRFLCRVSRAGSDNGQCVRVNPPGNVGHLSVVVAAQTNDVTYLPQGNLVESF